MRIAISLGLLALLAVVGIYAYEGLQLPDAAVPAYGYVVFGVATALLAIVGVALMGLLFYSSRHGYDDPPRYKR